MVLMIGFICQGIEILSFRSEDGCLGCNIRHIGKEYHIFDKCGGRMLLNTSDREYAINFADGYCARD